MNIINKENTETKKRITLTIYVTKELLDRVTKGYANALLNGYSKTKQSFLNSLLSTALSPEDNKGVEE